MMSIEEHMKRDIDDLENEIRRIKRLNKEALEKIENFIFPPLCQLREDQDRYGSVKRLEEAVELIRSTL